MNRHIWQGEWVDDATAEQRLATVDTAPPAEPLDPDIVIAACARVGRSPVEDPELALFLRPDRLRDTIRTELGEHSQLTDRPRDGVVEGWQPLGVLAHVVPANVAAAGPVSLVEGLLSGNVNLLKTSARRGLLTQRFAAELVAAEPRLAPYITVLRFGSAQRDWLRHMCRPADGVVVWGSEEAVAAVADVVPPGARLITWGPKISFGYLTRAAWPDEKVLTALAHDICVSDQQACTSPQVVYIDTASEEELWEAGASIARVLSDVDSQYPAGEPELDEQAEITNTVLVARHEEYLGLTRVWSGPDQRWHVIAETNPALRASPLYRTVWVKPLPRESIVDTLRPMRRYLQTAGIHAADVESIGVAPALFAAGVHRITPVGSMHESYPGEPHDGEYALRRYSRRVSLRLAGCTG